MYYWQKVDRGDSKEVYKLLNYARQQFDQENEMFEIVNCTNSDGFTPLHLAASEGYAQMIGILIKFQAQVDARTNSFRTPLHIASLRGNLNVIKELVLNKADINAKDIDGNTPCHFCSEYGHIYCLKFLLTRNPYMFANNNEEKSPIDVAISSEILSVSVLLIFNPSFFYRNSKSTFKIARTIGRIGKRRSPKPAATKKNQRAEATRSPTVVEEQTPKCRITRG